MKLKEIQMFGFKSFADKTTLKFGGGITIVVGPNGSGKSNIFDAMKWVLGEQSAKSLRGSKMEDVIFAGSDTRKTLGMAEVSIIMDNEDKSINMDYSEVKVTRRLYRSGESEYLINDNPVRLKDIVEMFMDTGVGIDSYSIISQGEVERIINAKPVERREIFEEAAGITKYIKKRDEALRKLESTDTHMVRINDILAEVKRQAGSLERQAKKAEKYRELKIECDDMALKLYKKQIKDRSSEYNRKKDEGSGIERKISEEETGIKTQELKYEEMKLTSLDMERKINEMKERFLIKQQEIKRLEDSLKFLSERHVELESRIGSLKNENVETVGKMESSKVEISSKELLLAEKESQIKAGEEELSGLEEAVKTVSGEYEGLRQKRDEKQALYEQLSGGLNEINNRLMEQEMAVKAVEESIQRENLSKKEIEEKARRAELELEKMSEDRVMKEEEIKNIKNREEDLIKQKMKKVEDLKGLDNTIKEMGISISRLESRRAFLKEMHEKLEGYGETVRKVLTDFKKQLEEGAAEGIAGAAGSLVTVDNAYEHAVEKAFGPLLQTVIVREAGLIEEIFDLYEKEKGDISILDSAANSALAGEIISKWRKKVSHPGIRAYLPDVVSTSPENSAVNLLFYNVYITDSREKAKEIIKSNPFEEQYYILTAAGELISSFGIFKKGAGDSEAGTGFLSRERQISEIENEVLVSKQKLIAIEEERAFRESKITGAEKTIEELSITYHNQYVEAVKDDERIKQKKEEIITFKAGVEQAGESIKKLEDKKTGAEAGVESINLEKKKMDEEMEGMKNRLDAATDEIKKKEEELNVSRKNLEDKRIGCMSAKSDYDLEKNNFEMLKTRLGELEASYSSTVKEIEELNGKVAQADEEKRSNTEKIDEYKNTLGSDENELNNKKSEFDGFNSEMIALNEKIRALSKERDATKEKQYEVKLKINELGIEIKTLYEKIQEELKASPSEEEINAVEVGEEEFKELSVKVGEYKEKMEKLGVTSLVAIEEFNELKQRLEFLQNQYDDLTKAKDNLNKVIKKTNEQSKVLFENAFGEIKEKFAYVFKKMMNGGEADLLLTDTENLLESGIDIIARPPGKKLQNITLLSGGEKAITAISLLFALFLIKASPFCIMDEIDAALDDINISRFTNLVKGFKKTQFIIISHNKITMETADVLYGVSMEKAGVSQIISVRLDKAGELEPVTDGK